MTYIRIEGTEEFRPERWLHDGIFQHESPFMFTAFQDYVHSSHGQRTGPVLSFVMPWARIRIEKEFAYGQMKVMAALLVFFFKFWLVDESKEYI
ncbi:cytochrome P450 [Artemisia annua]|uniref:Cytochrome P450 n=1 Tax=Artemisia annua TaxID=35608 RepID=A0A2U1N9Q5_ARTAN|nr:cytochrome P450 [Artemisia annua]